MSPIEVTIEDVNENDSVHDQNTIDTINISVIWNVIIPLSNATMHNDRAIIVLSFCSIMRFRFSTEVSWTVFLWLKEERKTKRKEKTLKKGAVIFFLYTTGLLIQKAKNHLRKCSYTMKNLSSIHSACKCQNAFAVYVSNDESKRADLQLELILSHQSRHRRLGCMTDHTILLIIYECWEWACGCMLHIEQWAMWFDVRNFFFSLRVFFGQNFRCVWISVISTHNDEFHNDFSNEFKLDCWLNMMFILAIESRCLYPKYSACV